MRSSFVENNSGRGTKPFYDSVPSRSENDLGGGVGQVFIRNLDSSAENVDTFI